MNRDTDAAMDPGFDPRLADWFEEDRDRAPGMVLETVLAAFTSIQQRRASRVPWRFPTMNVRALGAVAAAIVVVVALVAIGLPKLAGPGAGQTTAPPSGATPSPTATVSNAPSPGPSVEATPFPSFTVREGASGFTQLHVSPLYRYAMRYPPTWTIAAGEIANAPDDLPELGSVPSRADFYGDGATLGLMITAGPVSATRGDVGAFSAYVADRIPIAFSMYTRAVCTRSTRALVLDGEPANEFDYVCPDRAALWLTTVHGGLAYQVVWLVDAPFTAGDLRPKFDQFLQSFTFAP